MSAMERQAAPQHRKLTKTQILRRALFLAIGAGLFSVGIELFLVPNKVIDGGVTGVSIMVAHLTHIPLPIFLFVLNLPFLWLGYKKIGKTFTVSTLFAVLVMSLGTGLLHPVAPLTIDPLLAAVFGGIILGIGVGIVIRFGGSLDGSEIVAILLNDRLPFSVGEIIMFINIFILGSSGFVFGWDHAMYSWIAYYIAFNMIDITVEGFDQSRSVWIISDMYKEIGEAILHRLGRGVTYLEGEGAYTGESRKVLFVIITRLEEAKLRSIVEDWDEQAFLAVGHIHDVKGGRFKKKGIH